MEKTPVFAPVESKRPVLVIGAGISGLTSALELRRAGFSVRIIAKDISPYSNPESLAASPMAGAVVYPAFADHPYIPGWTFRTIQTLQEQERTAGTDATGIITRPVLELKGKPSPNPDWRDAVDWIGHADPATLPRGYADGFRFRAPVVDMPVYLNYLTQQFKESGGVIEEGFIGSVASAFNQAGERSIVINTTGLNARELVGDNLVVPARGQVLLVSQKRFPTTEVVIDEMQLGPDLTYVIPRQKQVVLGGTYEPENEQRKPRESDTRAILSRIPHIAPQFRGITEADIEIVKVGFRPTRPTIRVELEVVSTGQVLIHNYGHGGSGVTLAWGCAEEVAGKALQIGR